MATKLDDFTTAYLEAALWTETDQTNPEQGGEPLDTNHGIGDIEPDTLAEMIQDCTQFQADNAELIEEENLVTRATHSTESQAGHDFWLTRNQHGCGFWDGDWTEPAATKLTNAAHAFGEYHLSADGAPDTDSDSDGTADCIEDGGQVYKM